MKFCPKCGTFINSTTCYKCGYSITKKSKFTVLGIVVVIIIGILAYYSVEQSHIPSPLFANQSKYDFPIDQNLSYNQLVRFTLDRINHDRAENNLSPVLLSNNTAAQIHAEDVYNTGIISHWQTNGEKPYMTYSRLGGLGYVDQNVAIKGSDQYRNGCKQFNVICEKISPLRDIADEENQMMFNDSQSNWGHRDNILDKYHTHVSIGISYDEYVLSLVENFENNYIDFNQPILENNGIVKINATVFHGNIKQIDMSYDDLPSHDTYEQNKNAHSYQLGNTIASILKPLPPNQFYQKDSGYPYIIANEWKINSSSTFIVFDISQFMTKSGVYTFVIWIDDGKNTIPATSYSIFKS